MVKVRKGNKDKKGTDRNASSDSEDDLYEDNEFDQKNPFNDDEIEKFYNNKDKSLVDNLTSKNKKPFHYSSDEEEVLGIGDDDDDDDESGMEDNDYDLSDKDENEEENDENSKDDEYNLSRSWGSKKSAYYSGNKIQNEEDALLEEEEAKILQAKMMKNLDTNDFGLDAFKFNNESKLLKTNDQLAASKLDSTTFGYKETEFDEESLKKIEKNLSKFSKKEKLEYLQQESPEMVELIRDFKLKLEELQETLLPLFKSISSGQIPYSLAKDFIINKTKLYLMYCCYLSFYFSLKSERTQIENHPIVKNILQLRNLCQQTRQIDEKLNKEILYLVKAIKANKHISFAKPTKIKRGVLTNIKEQANDVRKMRAKELGSDSSDQELDHASSLETEKNENISKRAINYEIEKNKGLTPKRPKEYRNPRVRNRMKARKALIKRKSIVPKLRSQDKRYTGEATGIRMGVVRAVKIK